MALIASCPHCGTNFRITPLHLQAHGGDVRCGHCSQVFNAFSRLSTLQEPETSNLSGEAAGKVPEVRKAAKRTRERPAREPNRIASAGSELVEEFGRAVAQAETLPEATTPEAQDRETAIGPDISDAAETPDREGAIPEASVQELRSPQSAEEKQRIAEAAPDEMPASSEARSSTEDTRGPESKETRSRETEPRGRAQGVPPPDHAGEAPAADTAANELHGRRGPAHDRSREQSPRPDPHAQPAQTGAYSFETGQSEAASFAWSLGCLLLLIIFTGQTIYFYSADLAVAAPATKPFLEQYCELTECSVSPSRPKQLLDIESSDMRSDPARPSIITLSATVRNHALHPQALPLFELTFIDAQNRSLASRIFRPDMYLPLDARRTESIPPGKEFNVRLHLDTTDLNPAGYRLSLFYPPPDPST